MRSLSLAIAAAFTLAGCQTTIDNTDEAIRKALPVACASVETFNQAFLSIAAIHPLKANIVAAEKTAYDSAAAICAHPETATTMAVVIQVTTAATIIALQLKEAEKTGG